MSWSTSTAPPLSPSSGRFSCGMRSPCSRAPGPALPRPSLTSRPRTPHSSASTAVTSSRSWSAWTPTGGGAGSADAWASSHGATSSRYNCDRGGGPGRGQSQQAIRPPDTEVPREDVDAPSRGPTGLSLTGTWTSSLPGPGSRCFIQTETGPRCPRTAVMFSAHQAGGAPRPSCWPLPVGCQLHGVTGQGDRSPTHSNHQWPRSQGSCIWGLYPRKHGGRVHLGLTIFWASLPTLRWPLEVFWLPGKWLRGEGQARGLHAH